jgi:hypothetical protein
VKEEIIDHMVDDSAISMDQSQFHDKNGQLWQKQTTRGWQMLVEWKDGNSLWTTLKDLKESNPVEVAKYAVANNLVSEPSFSWWVPFTIRKRDRIIMKVKSKYWQRMHKYGIQLPKSVPEAYRIDEATGTDFWTKAIAKEMKNVMPAFKFTDDDRIPKGHS